MLKRLCSHPRDIEALMYQVLDSSSGQGWLVERVCLNAFCVMWKLGWRFQVGGCWCRAVSLTSGICEDIGHITGIWMNVKGLSHCIRERCVREKSDLIDNAFSSKIHQWSAQTEWFLADSNFMHSFLCFSALLRFLPASPQSFNPTLRKSSSTKINIYMSPIWNQILQSTTDRQPGQSAPRVGTEEIQPNFYPILM